MPGDYRKDGLLYSSIMSGKSGHFSWSASLALDLALRMNKGRRIFTLGQRTYDMSWGRAIYKLRESGLNWLTLASNGQEYYSYKELIHFARITFPKQSCKCCQKLFRKGWPPDHHSHTDQEWLEFHNGRARQLHEQFLQDEYFVAHGWTPVRQLHPGIDAFSPLGEWLEFVRDGALDAKDYTQYPAKAGNKPYRIVFVGRPPNVRKLDILRKHKVEYEIFKA